MLTVRQVPAVVAAPAALTAPSPGRPRRPTRAGDLRDQWGPQAPHGRAAPLGPVISGISGAASSTPRRFLTATVVTPELHPALPAASREPALPHLSQGPGPDSSSPPAAGRSPAVTVGA